MLKAIPTLVLLALVFVFVIGTEVFAELVPVKAQGTSECSSFFSNQKEKDAALHEAKKRAIEKFISSLDETKAKRLVDMKTNIFTTIDDYVKDVTELDSDKRDGKCFVTIQANIDGLMISKILEDNFKQDSKKAGLKKKKKVAFIFSAREVDTTTNVKDHTLGQSSDSIRARSDQSLETNAQGDLSARNSSRAMAEDERISSRTKKSSDTLSGSGGAALGQSENEGSASINADVKTESSREKRGVESLRQETSSEKNASITAKNRQDQSYRGESDVNRNTEQKNTEIKHSEKKSYRPMEIGTINAQLTELFIGQGGMKVADAPNGAELLGQLESVESVNMLRPKDIKDTVNAAREEGIDFLLIGTLDVSQARKDSVSGGFIRETKINANIYDVVESVKALEKAAAVGNLDYSGVGDTPDVAYNNALNGAVKSAAGKLITQTRRYILEASEEE